MLQWGLSDQKRYAKNASLFFWPHPEICRSFEINLNRNFFDCRNQIGGLKYRGVVKPGPTTVNMTPSRAEPRIAQKEVTKPTKMWIDLGSVWWFETVLRTVFGGPCCPPTHLQCFRFSGASGFLQSEAAKHQTLCDMICNISHGHAGF